MVLFYNNQGERKEPDCSMSSELIQILKGVCHHLRGKRCFTSHRFLENFQQNFHWTYYLGHRDRK